MNSHRRSLADFTEAQNHHVENHRAEDYRAANHRAENGGAEKAPKLIHVMCRPRWLSLLVLMLVVAAACAFLGAWQWDRSARPENGVTENLSTETPVSLTETVTPNTPTAYTATGQVMTTTGVFVAEDHDIVTNRVNGGETGFWVVGHFIANNGVSLAVARGWAPTREVAERVRESLSTVSQSGFLASSPMDSGSSLASDFPNETALQEITGRFVPTQAPEAPDRGNNAVTNSPGLSTMSVAAFANKWTHFETGDVYTGFLVAREAPGGLNPIDSPPPQQPTDVNWLNMFYAIEWAFFAGFAVFFWFRSVKDAWQRETEHK